MGDEGEVEGGEGLVMKGEEGGGLEEEMVNLLVK